MKRLVVILCVISAAIPVVFAADEKPIVVDDMAVGLYTSVAPHRVPLGGARVAHNVEFSDYPGEMSVREGYSTVGQIFALDSFLWNGIYSIPWKDDRRELIMIGDSAGGRDANIYSTGWNSLWFAQYDTLGFKFDVASLLSEMDGNSEADQGKVIVGYSFVFSNSDPWFTLYSGSGSITLDIDTLSNTELRDTLASVFDGIDSLVGGLTGTNDKYLHTTPGTDSIHIADSSKRTSIQYIDVNFTYRGLETVSGLTRINTIVTRTGVTITRLSAFVGQGGYYAGSRKLYGEFPKSGRPSYAKVGNRVYIGSSAGRGIIYDGRNVSIWPELSPGEVFARTIDQTAGLQGEYQYAVKFIKYGTVGNADSLFTDELSYVSKPVVSDSNAILITDWPPPPLYHSLLDEAKDSVSYALYRTTGGHGILDKYDTLYLVDTITFDTGLLAFPVGDVVLTGVDSTFEWVYIDTTSDQTLREWAVGDTSRWTMAYPDDHERWLIDTTGSGGKATLPWKPGGVHPVRVDSLADAGGGSTGIWGNAGDTISWKACMGYAWMAVIIDTVTMSRSDSGRSLIMWQESQPSSYISSVSAGGDSLSFSRVKTEKVTIELPRPSGNTGTKMVLLYRAPVKPLRIDSATVTITNYYNPISNPLTAELDVTNIFTDGIYVDLFHYIGAFTPGDTVVDTLGYDSLMSREVYIPNNAPPYVEHMVAVDDRLFVAYDDYLAIGRGRDTTAVTFDVLNRLNISSNDGDRVTSVWPEHGSVRIGKNKSLYTSKKTTVGSLTGYISAEYANSYGCVAGLSVQRTPWGYMFLSEDGVRIDQENQYQAYTFGANLVSAQLNNFNAMGAINRRKCVSAYVDDKYLLSFPALDTTYVASITKSPNGPRYSWSTWGFTFVGATLHSTASITDFFTPADTLYFIKSGDNRLYRYGNRIYDDTSYIPFTWQSGYLNRSDGYEYQVEDFGLHAISEDSNAATVEIVLDNEMDVNTGATSYYLAAMDTVRYHYFEGRPSQTALSWGLRIRSNPYAASLATVRPNGTTRFIGFDMNLIRRGRYRSQ